MICGIRKDDGPQYPDWVRSTPIWVRYAQNSSASALRLFTSPGRTRLLALFHLANCAGTASVLPAFSRASKVEPLNAPHPRLNTKETRLSNWFCVNETST